MLNRNVFFPNVERSSTCLWGYSMYRRIVHIQNMPYYVICQDGFHMANMYVQSVLIICKFAIVFYFIAIVVEKVLHSSCFRIVQFTNTLANPIELSVRIERRASALHIPSWMWFSPLLLCHNGLILFFLSSHILYFTVRFHWRHRNLYRKSCRLVLVCTSCDWNIIVCADYGPHITYAWTWNIFFFSAYTRRLL